MTTSEIALIDSNILVYATQTFSQFYLPAKQLRDKGIKGELSLCVCPQVLKEFFAVITSPKRVTQPCTSGEAEIKKYIESKNIIKLSPRDKIAHYYFRQDNRIDTDGLNPVYPVILSNKSLKF